MKQICNRFPWLGGVGVLVGGVLWLAHAFHLPFYAMMFLGIGTSHFAMNTYIKTAGFLITVTSIVWIVYKLLSNTCSNKGSAQMSSKY